jgi:tetratricopeptide (TPR) repeat protein
VNTLTYLPFWVSLLVLAGGALLLVPSIQDRVAQSIAGLPAEVDPWAADGPNRRFQILIILALSFLLISLRSATHLLGDGLLLVRELGSEVWGEMPRIDHAPLTFWLIETLYNAVQLVSVSAEDTYRLYSTVSGILYLIVVLRVAGDIGSSTPRKVLIAAFLLTPAYTQIFFGYAENYSLLFPGILAYLFLCYHSLNGRLAIWVPAALLGLLIPLHFTAAALAPSLVALVILRHQAQSKASEPSPLARVGKLFGQLTATVFVAGIIFALIGFDPVGYLTEFKASLVLPLTSDTEAVYHYRLLSWDHLLDVLNQYLLVAPPALIILCLRRNRSRSIDPFQTVLLVASIFPFIFTFVANPEIGASRDWDAFAYPAIPLTLWSALVLIDHFREPQQLHRAGILICGAVTLHTLPWIALNTTESAAEDRFSDLLERGHFSASARAYGWETLASHQRLRERPGEALAAYRMAAEANPTNPRYWNSIGAMSHETGRHRDALAAFEKTLELDPRFTEAYDNVVKLCYNLGNRYHDRREYEEAIEFYNKAVELDSSLYQAHYNLGDANFKLGLYREAAKHYRMAASVDPSAAEPLLNMGIAYYHLEDHPNSVAAFRRAIDRDPTHIDAYYNLGIVYRDNAKVDSAKACFVKVLTLDPKHPQAASIFIWLTENR